VLSNKCLALGKDPKIHIRTIQQGHAKEKKYSKNKEDSSGPGDQTPKFKEETENETESTTLKKKTANSVV